MPASHRNVHLFDTNDRNTTVGGLVLTHGITNTNLYTMVEIIVIFTAEYTLKNESDNELVRDSSPLQPGNYYICSQGFTITDELLNTRAVSQETGSRAPSFRDLIRLRDQRCVITRTVHLVDNSWRGFHAAHIVPLACAGIWNREIYSRWITIPPPDGAESINSVQNGMLLRSDIHELFDYYDFSINPDDNYKIVCFERDIHNIAGTYLDQQFLNHPQRPVDQVFCWHFRQAVLAKMKGAGECMHEHDFPPGTDMIASILQEPKAAERMQFELFSRLANHYDMAEQNC